MRMMSPDERPSAAARHPADPMAPTSPTRERAEEERVGGAADGRRAEPATARDHYRQIGAKGGSLVRDRHGKAYYAEIGRLGGEATKRTADTAYYRQIGQLGGRVSALRRRAKRWRDDQDEWLDVNAQCSGGRWDDWF